MRVHVNCFNWNWLNLIQLKIYFILSDLWTDTRQFHVFED